MKFTLALIAFSLLLVACKHLDELQTRQTYDEKRTTNATEVHQKIPGTWIYDTQYDNGSGGNFYHIITIGYDGNFSVSCTNEIEHVTGTWRLQEPVDFITNKLGRIVETRTLQDHGSDLVVITAKTNYTAFANGKNMSDDNVNFINYYPVIYVNDHELILAPGWSVAGRYRFIK